MRGVNQHLHIFLVIRKCQTLTLEKVVSPDISASSIKMDVLVLGDVRSQNYI